jgi:hypothetical protein
MVAHNWAATAVWQATTRPASSQPREPETGKVQPLSCTHLHPAHLPHFGWEEHWTLIGRESSADYEAGPPLVRPWLLPWRSSQRRHNLVSTLAAIISRTDSYMSRSEKGQILVQLIVKLLSISTPLWVSSWSFIMEQEIAQ